MIKSSLVIVSCVCTSAEGRSIWINDRKLNCMECLGVYACTHKFWLLFQHRGSSYTWTQNDIFPTLKNFGCFSNTVVKHALFQIPTLITLIFWYKSDVAESYFLYDSHTLKYSYMNINYFLYDFHTLLNFQHELRIACWKTSVFNIIFRYN